MPVIASVGHHTDRTLLDDVAALSCSTPTHAAESAVPVHCTQARGGRHAMARRLGVHGTRATAARPGIVAAAQRLSVHGRRARVARPAIVAAAQRLGVHGRRALLHRAQALARLSRAPGEHVAARARAAAPERARDPRRRAGAGSRASARASRAARSCSSARRTPRRSTRARATELHALALALAAHDPARTLERGYVLVTDRAGDP